MKCYCVVDFKSALKLVEQPTPTPTGKEVLVEVRAAGVCHSDLHIWEGGYATAQSGAYFAKQLAQALGVAADPAGRVGPGAGAQLHTARGTQRGALQQQRAAVRPSPSQRQTTTTRPRRPSPHARQQRLCRSAGVGARSAP